jgi:hypothetical protein
LSAIPRIPVRAPVALGVKVIVKVQLTPAATLDPQVLVWLKSAELAPASRTAVMLKALLPWLLSVTFCAGLVVPTF